MKTLTKVLAFFFASLIAFSIFFSPVNAGASQVTETTLTSCKTETVIPTIPSEVLEMLPPERAEVLSFYFFETQHLFDRLGEVSTSPQEYCTTKETMINVQKFFTNRIWATFFLKKGASKEMFVKLLEAEVYSKM